MKNRNLLLIFSGALVVVLLANGLEFGSRDRAITYSYQAVVCPKGESGTNLTYSLPNKNILIRGVGSKKVKLFKAGRTVINSTSPAAFIESKGVSITGWVTKSGSWAGGVLCTAPRDSQWFAGGVSDISGRGRIILVNSGLSPATVEIDALSDNQGLIKKTLNVKSNSISEIGLVSLTPGATATAFRISLLTGRVSAFLIDERGKGLSTFGGDVVNGQTDLATELVIPAIPVDSNTKLPAILRVGNPSSSDATISARLISKDGNFVPVGLGEVEVPAGRAANFDIPITQPSKQFGLRITSSKPIVASVYNVSTIKGRRDFVWSSAATELKKGQWAVSGISSKLVIAGEKINVYLEVTTSKQKVIKRKIIGNDIATWNLPADAKLLEIRGAGGGNFGALIVSGQGGSGVIPLIPGSTLTKSSVPAANIGVLNP